VLQDATQNWRQGLTLGRLNAGQAALFPTGRSGLYEIRVGQLRGEEPMRIVSGSHQRERVNYEAPPREGLDQELQRLIDGFNGPSKKLDGVVRAGLAHLWFEVLHPYEDGNGRVGRALLDMALAQDEGRPMRIYSVSAQLNRARDEYYDALERYRSARSCWARERNCASARRCRPIHAIRDPVGTSRCRTTTATRQPRS
jgi:Fic family protein